MPTLHDVELIDEFFAEHPAAGGEPDTIESDEVVTAIAKTMAELTCSQDGSILMPRDTIKDRGFVVCWNQSFGFIRLDVSSCQRARSIRTKVVSSPEPMSSTLQRRPPK
jgi:hypothetical protein